MKLLIQLILANLRSIRRVQKRRPYSRASQLLIKRFQQLLVKIRSNQIPTK